MIKKLSLTLLLLLAFVTNTWALNWNIDCKDYKVDTLNSKLIGPGTILTTLQLTGANNLQIFYTETDLKNPYVKFKAIKGEDKIAARATLSNMLETHTTAQEKLFAGVNADFFEIESTQEPLGKVISQGEVYTNGEHTDWPIVFFTKDNEPYFAKEAFYQFTINQKPTVVNDNRNKDALTLFTQRVGSTTPSTNECTEVEVAFEDPSTQLAIGLHAQLKVLGTPQKGSGKTTIQTNSMILSAQGYMQEFVQNLKVGDNLTLVSYADIDGQRTSDMHECLGGTPILLKKGNVQKETNHFSHFKSRHPRTAVGYNADKSKFYMVVIDGRTKSSIGATFVEVAEIMRLLGCTEALNLDGGGSSELYTQDFGIINNPSDKHERKVTDALFLASTAPQDTHISTFCPAQCEWTIQKGETFQPTFWGYNAYQVLIEKHMGDVALETEGKCVKVSKDRLTLKGKKAGTARIKATYQGQTKYFTLKVTDAKK